MIRKIGLRREQINDTTFATVDWLGKYNVLCFISSRITYGAAEKRHGYSLHLGIKNVKHTLLNKFERQISISGDVDV